MLSTLPRAKGDPILSLISAFMSDTRTDKIDLGIGVYRDEHGATPVLESVKIAEKKIGTEQTSKAYVGIFGNENFNSRFQANMLKTGSDLDSRSSSIQTPGGSGALRILADFLSRYGTPSDPPATVWISNPGYINHGPIFRQAGLKVASYPYLKNSSDGRMVIDGEALIQTVESLGHRDILVLQACCHNPSGAGPDKQIWERIGELAERNGFLPFIDNAYQGLGDGFEEDLDPVLTLLDRVEYAVIAASASKNFGLYRERTGVATIISTQKSESLNARLHLGEGARVLYSMPPDHGASVVSEILGNQVLTTMWRKELEGMRLHLDKLRHRLTGELSRASGGSSFDFIREQKGMFSMLPLNLDEIQRLRSKFGVYMLDNGRINIAGLNSDNLRNFVSALVEVKGWTG